jgi:hypothetical protein
MSWEEEFRKRIERIHPFTPVEGESIPISIKIRPEGGCYHRDHSPNAYRIIDEYIHSHPTGDIDFVEHESGPEILVYLACATAGLTLTASVINLVTAIIKARSEGIKRGDHRDAPLELIVRCFDENGKLQEERVLKINSQQVINEHIIETALQETTQNMFIKKKDKKSTAIKK